MSASERLPRLHALQQAAERIADGATPLGKKARELLRDSTGLSPQGVEYALVHCLEHRGGRTQLSQLARRAPTAPRAHILLSANVFVAAFRAIALGLSQSPQCFVRASRREPGMAELLHDGSGGAFELCDALSPTAGDHFWAYGSDQTLVELRRSLPGGVHLHAHGAGMGVAVIAERGLRSGVPLLDVARALARDVLAFDQKGCLSPRLALLEGDAQFCWAFAESLVLALDEAESTVPRGTLSADEQAEATRYERTMTYVGGARRAGKGLVVLEHEPERLFVPPVGRYIGLIPTGALSARLRELSSRITTVGVFGDESLPGRVQACLGERRVVDVGKMQTPLLDGPVDLRTGWSSELV